jgi:hypothetical protein
MAWAGRVSIGLGSKDFSLARLHPALEIRNTCSSSDDETIAGFWPDFHDLPGRLSEMNQPVSRVRDHASHASICDLFLMMPAESCLVELT